MFCIIADVNKRKIYIIGQLIGRCVYLGEDEFVPCKYNKFSRTSKFKCSCGNIFRGRLQNVKRFKSGCGCGYKNNSRTKSFFAQKFKSEYSIWKLMKNRCNNKNLPFYKNYGGRGIVVCDRWLNKKNGFMNFISDMGGRPSKNHSIDRINNDGNYEPSNCRWANDFQQARNKTINRIIEFKGEKKCLAEWSEILNVDYHTLKYRLNRGWDMEVAALFKGKKYSRPIP